MKKILAFIFLLTALSLCVLTASADQEGNKLWCNIDKYGCFETAEDGSTYYIMFWSESARKAIMGDLTAPYTNVVDYCYNCKSGTMDTGSSSGNSGSEVSRSESYRKQLENGYEVENNYKRSVGEPELPDDFIEGAIASQMDKYENASPSEQQAMEKNIEEKLVFFDR